MEPGDATGGALKRTKFAYKFKVASSNGQLWSRMVHHDSELYSLQIGSMAHKLAYNQGARFVAECLDMF